MKMKDVVFWIGRVVFALTTLVCLGFTIFGLVMQMWPVAGVCLLLTAGFGYITYRDARKLLKS